jgi:hypothetical protein
MKLLIILYIALGLVLSLAAGIEYKCEGPEMFSDYYGSPFIFKQKSLGSSMEYFYSISGLALNIMIWSGVLFLIDRVIQKFIKNESKWRWANISYKVIIALMMAFTTLDIAVDSIMIGHGFEERSNYWYWNVDKEAKAWGVTCSGELVFLRK